MMSRHAAERSPKWSLEVLQNGKLVCLLSPWHFRGRVLFPALAWPIPAQLASTCARPRLIVFAGRLAGATAALFLSSPGPVFFPRSRRFDSLFSQVDTFRDIS